MAMPRSRDLFFGEEEDVIAQLLMDFGLFIGLYKTQMWMKGRKQQDFEVFRVSRRHLPLIRPECTTSKCTLVVLFRGAEANRPFREHSTVPSIMKLPEVMTAVSCPVPINGL